MLFHLNKKDFLIKLVVIFKCIHFRHINRFPKFQNEVFIYVEAPGFIEELDAPPGDVRCQTETKGNFPFLTPDPNSSGVNLCVHVCVC